MANGAAAAAAAVGSTAQMAYAVQLAHTERTAGAYGAGRKAPKAPLTAGAHGEVAAVLRDLRHPQSECTGAVKQQIGPTHI